MRSRIARIVAVIACLVAAAGISTAARAETTQTLAVTGNIVDTSMSLTISETSFSFGDIDTTGDSYNDGTSVAKPYPVSNDLYFPDGTAWFAREPITLTVTSPASWSLSMCATSGTNIGAPGSPKLSLAQQAPQVGSGSSVTDYLGLSLDLCSSASSATGGVPVTEQGLDLLPVYFVFATDPPGAFSATIRFTLSAI